LSELGSGIYDRLVGCSIGTEFFDLMCLINLLCVILSNQTQEKQHDYKHVVPVGM